MVYRYNGERAGWGRVERVGNDVRAGCLGGWVLERDWGLKGEWWVVWRDCEGIGVVVGIVLILIVLVRRRYGGSDGFWRFRCWYRSQHRTQAVLLQLFGGADRVQSDRCSFDSMASNIGFKAMISDEHLESPPYSLLVASV